MVHDWGDNSCRLLRERQLLKQPPACPRSCLEPSEGQCVDYKAVKLDEGVPNVVKNFLEPEIPVRRRIDLVEVCAECGTRDPEKCCNLCEAQAAKEPNLCSTACRPQRTMLNTRQFVQSTRPRPPYKHSVFLDENTLVGRVFPMKFRIRRRKCECQDCRKDLAARETVTGNEDLILLSNCCNVEIYPRQKIENWHRVPVSTITGEKHFSKKIVDEVCQLETKKVPPPPPPPVEEPKKRKTSIMPKKKKKKKKKKKGKKGKKGKKKK
ncbi:uncharacterized protein [Drosophila virilis]|uniref:Uncharacterized protein n=1 Tax=Drosophila virilis TaxID=7244 RepID=B4MFQ6_DROVI|nr:uncharacterized protein LOC6636361 [Drosophila virilis]EDW57227.1 uncharacterized protein Dvir_GJ14988 [Drosophila virilis]